LRAGGSGHDLWQARDLDTGLQELLAASIRVVGAGRGIFQKLDAQGDLHVRAQLGYDEEYLSCFRKVSASDNRGCGRAVRTGKAVFIPDIELDADYRPYAEGARLARYRAVLACPIISPGGNILGVMSAHFAEPTAIPAEAIKLFDLHAKVAACLMEGWPKHGSGP
jgi:GAF domain-containing protein